MKLLGRRNRPAAGDSVDVTDSTSSPSNGGPAGGWKPPTAVGAGGDPSSHYPGPTKVRVKRGPPRWLVITRRILGWVTTLIFIAVLVLAWPLAWGGKFSWTVVSGKSMEPTLYQYDLVTTFRTDDYQVGDIIVYKANFDEKSGLVVHRIVKINPDGTYVTKGDNNNFIDPWVAQPDNIRGEVIWVFPSAAKYVLLIRSPLFWILPLAIMVTWFLWPAKVEELAAEVTPDGVDDPAEPEGPYGIVGVDDPSSSDGPYGEFDAPFNLESGTSLEEIGLRATSEGN